MRVLYYNRLIKVFIIAALFTVILIVFMLLLCRNKENCDYSSLAIEEIELNRNTFNSTIVQLSSGKSFVKYEYEIKNSALYLIIYSITSNEDNISGLLQVSIEDELLTQVERVYFKNKEQVRLVYKK